MDILTEDDDRPARHDEIVVTMFRGGRKHVARSVIPDGSASGWRTAIGLVRVLLAAWLGDVPTEPKRATTVAHLN